MRVMQRGFVLPGEAMAVEQARAIVPTVRGLVDLFRARRLPVVFTEFVYSPELVAAGMRTSYDGMRACANWRPTGANSPFSNLPRM